MGKYRDDLSERAIQFDLLNGMSITGAAVKYKCSKALICKIRDDKRTPPKDIPPEQLCVCCHYRPKAPGLRFLCEACFRYAEDEADDQQLTGYKMTECGWDELTNT